MSSARYGGAWPDKDEKTKHASLYVAHMRILEQSAVILPTQYNVYYIRNTSSSYKIVINKQVPMYQRLILLLLNIKHVVSDDSG